MIIKLSPQVANEPTKAPVISVTGLTLTIDDQVIDLSVIPEGGQAESDNEWLIGTVTREQVTIRYPYSTYIYEPNQSTNPLDYEFDIVDGVVSCPLIKKPVIEEVLDNV